jgi:hypothetical protein
MPGVVRGLRYNSEREYAGGWVAREFGISYTRTRDKFNTIMPFSPIVETPQMMNILLSLVY